MQSDIGFWICNQFYNHMPGSLLPLTWFAPLAPRPAELSVSTGRLKLQIVSHCWQYAHLSLFQLSSLVNYPPRNCELTYTLFYAHEDEKLRELIAHFDAVSIPGVSWDWQCLPRHELFRRAIGRNRASLSSTADWIWFSDCDLIFHQGCLDSLAAALDGLCTGLVYPDHEAVTDLLDADHPMLNQTLDESGTVDVDPEQFHFNAITKPKGAFQIVHGDVARAVGYCDSISLYQQPSDRWRKTFEDTVFRRMIDYPGTPVPVERLLRIRHAQKGRYAESSRWSGLRGWLRRSTDRQGRGS